MIRFSTILFPFCSQDLPNSQETVITLLPALFRNVSTGVYRSVFGFFYRLSQYEDILGALPVVVNR